jgi:hypothetical protein
MLAVQIRHYAWGPPIGTASGPCTVIRRGAPVRSIWRGMFSGRRLEGSQAVLLAVLPGAVAVHGNCHGLSVNGAGVAR